jgi:hypothetical protein
LDQEGEFGKEVQTNQLSEKNIERRDELRVFYVGEPTIGDGGGMEWVSCVWYTGMDSGSEQGQATMLGWA